MKTITVFTGTRAEFGILKPLLRAIQSHDELTLKLAVGGTHLSQQHGYTKQEILDAGFAIDVELDFLVEADGETLLPYSLAKSIEVSAAYLEATKPDFAVILGDRFEALGFGLACFTTGVAISHIHGGELTTGALDDAFRHALTKFSSLHFAAAEVYRKRIIQLGQQPATVFNVGPLSADNMHNAITYSKDELFSELGVADVQNHVAFLSIHPETVLSTDENIALVENTLAVLDGFPDLFLFISSANNDPDGRLMNDRLKGFAQSHQDRVVMRPSFGQVLFYNCLWHSQFIIGNSSSAIIEAPMLQTPSINIGNRQNGREFSDSVTSVTNSLDAIRNAVQSQMQSTSGSGVKRKPAVFESVAQRIIDALLAFDTQESNKFYDLD